MLSTLKNSAAAGYQGAVKIELLQGAGLLSFFMVLTIVFSLGERVTWG